MTSTVNDTKPEIDWAREATQFGTAYHAATGTWKYTIDQPSKGHWALRGWGPYGLFLYREDTTLKGAKAQAADHQADQAKAAAAVESLAAKLKPTFIALDEGMQLIGRTAASAATSLSSRFSSATPRNRICSWRGVAL